MTNKLLLWQLLIIINMHMKSISNAIIMHLTYYTTYNSICENGHTSSWFETENTIEVGH